MYFGQCMVDCHSQLDAMHDSDELKKVQRLNKIMHKDLIKYKEEHTVLENFKKNMSQSFKKSTENCRTWLKLLHVILLKRMISSQQSQGKKRIKEIEAECDIALEKVREVEARIFEERSGVGSHHCKS